MTKLGEYRPVFQTLARYIGDFIGTLRTSDYDLRKVHEMCANEWVICGVKGPAGEGSCISGGRIWLSIFRRDDDSNEGVGWSGAGRRDVSECDGVSTGSATGANGRGGTSE
jgi:hypothetical protein